MKLYPRIFVTDAEQMDIDWQIFFGNDKEGQNYMFEQKFINKVLKEHIDKGIKKYIIYPFGPNGMNVKNYLQDYFGLQPLMIIDNGYAKYNEKINRFEDLKAKYMPDMYIILTAEGFDLNRELTSALLEFVSEDHIISLYDILVRDRSESTRLDNSLRVRFTLDHILPQAVDDEKTCPDEYKVENGKIKVRILHTVLFMWNALKTICEAFERDDRFDVLIVLGVNQSPDAVKQMKSGKHRFIAYKEYKAAVDKPDVMIYTVGWDTYSYHFRPYTKLIVHASMELVRYSNDINDFWRADIEEGLMKHNPDYILFDSMIYRELVGAGYQTEKIVEMGNAKYDGIYNMCQEKVYSPEWSKLNGKKVIFWTTAHGIYSGNISREITWDIYAKTIFAFALENENIGLIFRPHKTLLDELLKHGYWNQEDFSRLRQYCNLSPNIVWDESDSYESAFSLADALITDGYCGIQCSALPTLKPICLLFRSKKDTPCHPELADSLYTAYDTEELISYCEMVKKDQDDMYDTRKAAAQKFVKHFDGKNGERIKEFIEEKYFEMMQAENAI